MRPIQDSHRALRRHDRTRLKNKRRHHHGIDHFQQGMEKRAAKTIDTPTPCSCFSCGNPRKHLGERTIGERRDMQDQLYTPDTSCDQADESNLPFTQKDKTVQGFLNP